MDPNATHFPPGVSCSPDFLTDMELNATLEADSGNWCTPNLHVLTPLWYLGLGASCAGVLAQAAILACRAKCRKYDELVLLQLSTARLLNTVCEHLIMTNSVITPGFLKYSTFTVAQHTDAALVCWMFVFSKHLFDKIVVVFVEPHKLLKVSAAVWLVTAPIGVLCPVMIIWFRSHFIVYYRTYVIAKFITILVNALFFVKIFLVAFGNTNSRGIRSSLKTAVVWFVLVCLTSLQVLATDIASIFYGECENLIVSCCVINSFQVVVVTALFLMIVKQKIRRAVYTSERRPTRTCSVVYKTEVKTPAVNVPDYN